MSEPSEKVFDPFHHDGEPPNMLQPNTARMLELNAPTMVDPEQAVEVDPDSAKVVPTDQADMVDTDEVREVDTSGARLVQPDTLLDQEGPVQERPDQEPDPAPRRARTEDPGPAEQRSSQVLAIVGAPGAGKTTVGRLLAERLGAAFTDIDTVIEEQSGRTIREIFADDGEDAFRALEESTTLAALGGTGVISLGGGAVLSSRIRAALADVTVVWLEVSAASAISRAGLDQARPLLMGNVRGTLIKLLAERTPLYREVATHTVGNNGDDPAAVADEILGLLSVPDQR